MMNFKFSLAKALLAVLVVMSAVLNAGTSEMITLSGKNAEALLPGTAEVKLEGKPEANLKDMLPIRVYMKQKNELKASDFFSTLTSQFQLDVTNEMVLVDATTDQLGMIHFRYQQYYKSLKIIGAEYIIHESKGVVVSANGRSAPLLKIGTQPALPQNAALGKALNKLGVTSKSLRSVTFVELAVSSKDHNMADKSSYSLVYVFDITTTQPEYNLTASTYRIEVDADQGDIINIQDLVLHGDVPRQGITRYNGTQSITVDRFQTNPDNYRLRENSRSIETLNNQLAGTNDLGNAVDITDPDGNFVDPDPIGIVEDGVSVHWGMGQTYDYFLTNHNLLSIDGNGHEIRSYIRVEPGSNNAFYLRSERAFGFRMGTVALDVIGHEFAHGVTHFSSNLGGFEGGSLNESFSDIFGTLVEFWATPGVADWLVGEDIGTVFRDLSDPKAEDHPDTYLGEYWDSAGLHGRGGPQNFWFYLLSEGGSGTNDAGHSYQVTGIGKNNAGLVAYRNLTVYLTSTSRYDEAREGAIDAARDLFGEPSQVFDSNLEAWRAVGVPSTIVSGSVLPPSNLTVTAFSSNNVDLTWQDNSDNENGFNLQRAEEEGPNSYGPFDTIANPVINSTAYSDNTVNPNTGYRYRVRAFNNTGNSTFSNVVEVITLTGGDIPAAPSNLLASATSSSSISLNWQDNSNNETQFRIERAIGAAGSFSLLQNVGANVTSYFDVGLISNTQYRYRVLAENVNGNSGFSNTATATTSTTGTAPAEPSSLIATAVNSTTINLNWQDNSSNEAQFRIERAIGSGSFSFLSNVAANTTTFTNTGLATSTTYSYRVRAENASGNSGFSNVATATPSGTAPNAPTNLLAEALSSTSVELTWVNNTLNAEVQVHRAIGAGSTSFELIANLPINTQFYVNEDLNADTDYGYKVRAKKNGVFSVFSNIADVTTPPGGGGATPAAPSDLVATGATATSVSLAWSDNSNNEDYFVAEAFANVGGVTETITKTLTANTTSYTFPPGLTEGVNYRFRVKASNSAGDSDWSNEIFVTTDGPPENPSSLSATFISHNRIDIQWNDRSNNEDNFEVHRAIGGGSFLKIATLAANSTSFSNTALSSETTYRYKVKAISSLYGDSGFSNTISATTTAPAGAPAAPSLLFHALILGDNNESIVGLNWQDNSPDEEGFEIHRSVGGSDFSFRVSLNANVDFYEDPPNDFLEPNTEYQYKVRAFNSFGSSDFSNTVIFTTPSLIPDDPPPPIATKELSLSAYPNPFNPTTTLHYGLPEEGYVTLKVYNTLGQEVRTLANGHHSEGFKSVVWDGRNNLGQKVGSGLYIYQLITAKGVLTHKLLLMK